MTLILQRSPRRRVAIVLPDGRFVYVGAFKRGGQVHITFDAPDDIRIVREELLERDAAATSAAAADILDRLFQPRKPHDERPA